MTGFPRISSAGVNRDKERQDAWVPSFVSSLGSQNS